MRQAMMPQEHVLYRDHSVLVSNTRLVVTKGGSYAVAKIAQITSGRVDPKRTWRKPLIFGPLFLSIGGYLNQYPTLMKYNLLLNGWIFLVIGAWLLLIAFFNILSQEAFPRYVVEIRGSFGTHRPVMRRSEHAVLKIVAALNEAIAMHNAATTEVFMGDFIGGDKVGGDKVNGNKIGNIIIGTGNTVNASAPPELAATFTMLTSAIMASTLLPDHHKQEQAAIVAHMGNEAAKPQPDMSVLRSLAGGLVATLKVVPDVAQAVYAAIPVFRKFNL